jgi:MIP family channel proteins
MTATRVYLAEVMGTYLLTLFGTGAVASAVMSEALNGLWQVALVWGFGVSLAIYATAAISGAHINPAVSLAFAIFRPKDFPWQRLLPYWSAQLGGGILAGLTVLAAWGPFIDRFEEQRGLVRGEPGSQLSAMVFGEYFPNPALFGADSAAHELVTPLAAVAVEALGTAVLVFMIFAITDPRNRRGPARWTCPLLIGFTVTALIILFAPITQAGWNPARDFGPRIVAFFAGWEDIAIPGPRNGFWVYIVGPLLGGSIGAAAYDLLIRPGLAEPSAEAAHESAE